MIALRQVRCVTSAFLSLWFVHLTCLFCIRGDLTKHRRKHTGEKPFKCDWDGCNSAFTQSSAMRHICFPFSAVCSFHMFVLHSRQLKYAQAACAQQGEQGEQRKEEEEANEERQQARQEAQNVKMKLKTHHETKMECGELGQECFALMQCLKAPTSDRATSRFLTLNWPP